MRSSVPALLALALGIGGSAIAQAPQEEQPGDGRPGLGSPPAEELVRVWNIDISPDGENLPEGSGSVAEGKAIYEQQCVSCHGQSGEGPMDRLVGGKGSLDTQDPVKTVGSYWPYATTLYDYIHRSMPFNDPQSLSPDEVYAVTAYVLNMNGLVPEDAVMDRGSLPEVQMPNRDGFRQTDTITEAKTEACMAECTPLAVRESETPSPGTIEEEQVQ